MSRQILEESIESKRETANRLAYQKIIDSDPHLIDVNSAGEAIPGMAPNLILTSGMPLPWSEYTGGQRQAILYGAVYEGLAKTLDEADKKIASGEIHVRSTQDFNAIGSVAGIYTYSMPVFVVRDESSGSTAYCNLYEGKSRHRLNYGSYNQEVRDGLQWLEKTMAPVLKNWLHNNGPLGLRDMMSRSLRLGDELHSRNTAATMLFQREMANHFLTNPPTAKLRAQVTDVLEFFYVNDYAFLRLSMAAAKATADAAHGVEYSSVVTGQVINCKEYSIRISGIDNTWFSGKHPTMEGKFFDGFSESDAQWIGGESCFTELTGLGAMAQACAPSLMEYQGGNYDAMINQNQDMYALTVGEHPHFRIPAFGFRGTPVAVDLFRVVNSGTTPLIDGGLAGKNGGQIGAGVLRPDISAFTKAMEGYQALYAD